MTNQTLKAAPWWQVDIRKIGEESSPLVVIDNFFPTPEVLTQDASHKTFTANAPYFPGVRAAVPSAYFKPLVNGLSHILANTFGYGAGVNLQECHYSIVTTPGKDLNMMQRLPHIDGDDDRKVALLHYLCDKDHGGTAFYKQCRTGYETVSNARYPAYKQAVEVDHKNLGPPEATYFSNSDARFEQIAKIDAKFNRAVLYFGVNLHSILVGSKPLASEPQNGRLTINSFLSPL
ncbi:MAG: hypothetical protein JKY25_09740 [Robiginitomaculum sp.]|nr:hypothetical protein [Robiginitomaculum sp.]